MYNAKIYTPPICPTDLSKQASIVENDDEISESVKEELEENIEFCKEKIEALEFLQSKLSGRVKRVKGGCSAPKCVSYDENIFLCSLCQNPFHTKCSGISEREFKCCDVVLALTNAFSVKVFQ